MAMCCFQRPPKQNETEASPRCSDTAAGNVDKVGQLKVPIFKVRIVAVNFN